MTDKKITIIFQAIIAFSILVVLNETEKIFCISSPTCGPFNRENQDDPPADSSPSGYNSARILDVNATLSTVSPSFADDFLENDSPYQLR